MSYRESLRSSTWISHRMIHGQLAIASPVTTKHPIFSTAGWTGAMCVKFLVMGIRALVQFNVRPGGFEAIDTQ